MTRNPFCRTVPLDLELCDPGGMLRHCLRADPPAFAARDALIVWLLRLPAGLDPADAARVVLQACRAHDRRGEAAALAALLAEVGDWPQQRLRASAVRYGPVH